MAIRGPGRVVTGRFERLTGEPITSCKGLEHLVAQAVPESTELDFKRLAYNDPSEDKHDLNNELRKDVTSFANAVGGVIVLGVTDKAGQPGKILGIDGKLENVEGNLRSVLRSRIWPPLDDVEIVAVENSAPGKKGCLLIVIPASPRAPHAVQPHGDDDALKYARRVGRHTEWLSETQVADLYRNRFASALSQSDRATQILDDLEARLPLRGWLLLGLVPDSPGQFLVSRATVEEADNWWIGRRRLDLLPPTDNGPAEAAAGPRRVVLARSDGATSVPVGVYGELHDDGSCGLALELQDGPSGNPSFFLDDLVSQVLEGITAAVDFSVARAVAGGYGLLAARLHFPERAGAEIQCWDPSFNTPSQLPLMTKACETAHTIELDAIQASNAEAVSAAAIVAGHLAQFFGEPDARYLTPDGAVRANQYPAKTRDQLVAPRAKALDVPLEGKL
jgi:hypothetical protein